MYNTKDIQFVGKHDYDRAGAEKYAKHGFDSFSVNVFQWLMKTNGKEMKKSLCIVRVHGRPCDKDRVFQVCESIVKDLDLGTWDGRKSVKVS
jgi:hypothetical protein